MNKQAANKPFVIEYAVTGDSQGDVSQQVAEVTFACGTRFNTFHTIYNRFLAGFGGDLAYIHYVEYGWQDDGRAVRVSGRVHVIMMLIGEFANNGEDNLLNYKILSKTATNALRLKINDRLAIAA